MSFGAQFINSEGKVVLDTSRAVYQFIGKYAPDTVSKIPLGQGNSQTPSSTTVCVGGTLELPEDLSSNSSDWLVFFRYVPQNVEFSCGAIVSPVIQNVSGTNAAFTGLFTNGGVTSNVQTFLNLNSWSSACGYVKMKIGDYVCLAQPTASSSGYYTFSNPTYAYITNIQTLGSSTRGTTYQITFDRSITSRYQDSLMNITSATKNRFSVEGFVNCGSSVNPSDLEFYVFCRMNNNAVVFDSNYGMRTYDSLSNCTFDSNRRVLNISARSTTPNLTTLTPPLYGGYNGYVLYNSTSLPSYSVDVGQIPTNWAISSSSHVGIYYNGSGCQNYRANYSYTYLGSRAYVLQPLSPCVSIEDKTKLAIRPTQIGYIQPDAFLPLADFGNYFLTSSNNNQLCMVIDVSLYQ